MSVFDPKPANSKWSRYDVSPLLALDPRNAPPAPLPGAPSGGAFGSPAPAGGSPAYETDPATGQPVGAFEATQKLIAKTSGKQKSKEEKPFFRMWQEGTDEEKDAIADQVEGGFKGKGINMRDQAEQIANSNPVAMRLAEEFGYVPSKEKAGKEGFRTQEGAFAQLQQDNKKKKSKWDRKAWGGFLMEVGLRVLASQRSDAGGAIGEGVLGTMDARRQRATENEDRAIAKEELERQRRLDEAQNRRAENDDRRADRAEDRADEELGLSKTREERYAEESAARVKEINDNISSGNIKVIMDKNGRHHVVKTNKPGVLRDENGKPIESETTADLSASQIATFERQVLRDRAAIYKQVRAEAEGVFSNDPEVQAIQDADPKERKQLIDALVDRRLQDIYGGDVNTTSGDALDWEDLQ